MFRIKTKFEQFTDFAQYFDKRFTGIMAVKLSTCTVLVISLVLVVSVCEFLVYYAVLYQVKSIKIKRDYNLTHS